MVGAARGEAAGVALLMKGIQRLLAIIDGWQRTNRPVGLVYAVIKKFGDDNANQFVVALGWYGFVAIYPLLLVVITIFGFTVPSGWTVITKCCDWSRMTAESGSR